MTVAYITSLSMSSAGSVGASVEAKNARANNLLLLVQEIIVTLGRFGTK